MQDAETASEPKAGDDPAPTPSVAESARSGGFPIVGIGASAGGLAAFEAFFSGMPAEVDTGMAFVLVQHLAPDHKSILTELVKRYTRMAVFEVEDGMVVKPNCAYIIPPNRDMAFLNGALQLLEPVAPRGQRMAIDFFFRSLAQDQRERAICIVLSGTGSDGTQGMRAIKAEGGMAMAQNPESTEFGAMPRSAISTGLVDYTLPPAEMPAQLIAYCSRAMGKATRRVVTVHPTSDDVLNKIFVLLRAHTSHDFSRYKPNTVIRRVERRMAVQQIEELDGYLRYLQETPSEVEALFRDLLIGVTSFFRDSEAFAALEQHVAQLLMTKAPGSLVRVWVPGCSTGEEAYSLAMLFREQMDGVKRDLRLQMFATDIDARAIETARSGQYAGNLLTDLSAQRLERFFAQDGGAYRIHKSVRDILVFSEHNLIRDPPFSKLDLISCRNLLIYMGPELQRKLIPLFHYALNPAGILFLGSSESTGDFPDLFAISDRKAKIYQRKDDAVSRAALEKFQLFSRQVADVGDPEYKLAPRAANPPLRELAERALLQHAPVGALVNERGELLYFHGQTGKYLQPAPGEAELNVIKMAREGLRHELTAALRRAVQEKSVVTCPGLRVKTNGDFTVVNLTIRPVSPSSDEGTLFLVMFEEVAHEDRSDASAAGESHNAEAGSAVDTRIAALQVELRARDEYLEATREQCQTTNEELKSSNEELQSTNEELQSANEELETSKEELQSVNEELATVNAELQTKVTDLSRANNDMNNLLAGTGVGTIFVDYQIRVQRFTPAVTQLVNLIRSDVGRPLAHIVSNLTGYDQLIMDVQAVLDTLTPREVEVRTHAGAWFLLRIRPYRTLENVIEGAVITFTEVTELKSAQAALRDAEALRRMAVVMRDAHDAITVQDLDGRILAWNQGAERMYGWTEAEALLMNIRELIPQAQREEALAVVRRLSQAEVLKPLRAARLTKTGDLIEVSLTVTALVNEQGRVYAVSTIERESKERSDV